MLNFIQIAFLIKLKGVIQRIQHLVDYYVQAILKYYDFKNLFLNQQTDLSRYNQKKYFQYLIHLMKLPFFKVIHERV